MRQGFTLLELIFALVVISIVMLGIPGLFKQTANQAQETLKLEAVTQAYRSIGTALSYPWDEHSRDENLSRSLILDVSNFADPELARETNTSRYRRGNFNEKVTRIFYPTKTYATLGKEIGESKIDDLDDYNGHLEQISKVSNRMGMILNIDLNYSVYYIRDSANYSTRSLSITISPLSIENNSTNIKLIEVNASLPDVNNEYIILRAFSCNIGEPKIAYKDLTH
ncbi:MULTISPECIES: type II secretion system protein [unclassified Nitratiruptor]|uniref:type II secretion system protein n=1 Tax=unclassified Nitratiruptor TaxID=2624044 RepID=UPI001915D041|nr:MULTISPECIES: type II secretion system protein [unclassified Nitratiruptor]BCD60660.1 hypothetical protein NitYY0810_C1436 [Nitratiruptor sp. YY08-10]BCD64591.1 hypothetical protein NitYY0814_C1443 [Nitratiruptor sp. YY08-14]